MTSIAKKKRKKPGQPAPRWREFMQSAWRRLVAEWKSKGLSAVPGSDYTSNIAGEIVRHGDGAAFLKAVRRGRSTQRQNLRYQLLREVETIMGDAVPRRRPDANTPDSLALKRTVQLELQAYADAGSGKIGGADSTP